MSSFSQQARQRIQQGLEGPEGEAVNANSTLLPHIEGLYETEEQKAERIRRARVRSRISAVMWGVAAYFTFTLSDIYQVTMNDPRVDWIALWLSIICSSVFLGIGFYLVVWLPRIMGLETKGDYDKSHPVHIAVATGASALSFFM
eukprot:TRINITY_DN853_c0_g2_i4.p1 TRINITY_DN853_c0_g2~~TRINITY_DN853_c0_g2_i4.p1  ORF type:complete len:152 (-),score=23.04 TRINITY_DN853_c0_g2_i4:77-511(-)